MTKNKSNHGWNKKPSAKRYVWAGQLAKVAMGKTKQWGDKQSHYAATDDPLAWWCLTDAIASGGPD